MLLPVLKRYFDLEETGTSGEYLFFCPFHEDVNKKSTAVNVKKRKFNCFACGEKGSVVKLLAKVTGHTEDVVRYELNWLYQTLDQKLPDFTPTPFIEALHKKTDLIEFLVKERLWSLETIEKFMIGWDERRGRITIPVTNIFGQIVNVRYYKSKAAKDEAKVINYPGFGKARLFGCDSILESSILLVEGEPDALAAISQGWAGISSTAGAQHFDATWQSHLSNKSLVVCYDADEAGRAGADKVAAKLGSSPASLRIIRLADNQDFTDYLVAGGTRVDFNALVEATTPENLATAPKVSDSDLDETIYPVTLAESSQHEYFKKFVSVDVMISGKTLSPYIVPEQVKVSCPMPNMKICNGCGLGFRGGETTLHFTHNTEELLQLVETTKDQHDRIFKQMCQIPARCKIAQFDILEAQNVEEVKVIPDLDFSADGSEYVLRQVFYMGHGLRPNVAYRIVGLTLPHPKTQQVTYLVNKADPLEDSVKSFELTPELVQELEIFTVESNTEET